MNRDPREVPIVVYKNRTTVVGLDLGFDVSGDTLVSEIREGETEDSELIATWDISFVTDGTDGEVVLTLDNSDAESADITQVTGYMDMKRISSGEPLPVFEKPLKVVFRGSVTE